MEVCFNSYMVRFKVIAGVDVPSVAEFQFLYGSI